MGVIMLVLFRKWTSEVTAATLVGKWSRIIDCHATTGRYELHATTGRVEL